MTSSPFEEPNDKLDAFLADTFAEQAEFDSAYQEIQTLHTAKVDETIDALIVAGVNIQAVLQFRDRLGEETGIEKTILKLYEVERKLQADPAVADEATMTRRGLMRRVIARTYSAAFIIDDLAANLAMHELSPKLYSRRAAEAMIITHEMIAEEDKSGWLKAIGILMHDEGLSADDPDSYAYVEDYANAQVSEDKAVRETMKNIRRLTPLLIKTKRELDIQDHDDLPSVEHLLLGAVSMICTDPAKQAMLREHNLNTARIYAKRINWSDELFDEVVARLQAS